MSSVLVLQSKNDIFMGADTAVSTSVESDRYRLSEDGKKIFEFKDMLIFCSGDLTLSYSIMDKFEKEENKTIERLQEISIQLTKERNKDCLEKIDYDGYKDYTYSVETLVAHQDSECLKLYQMPSNTDFEIKELEVVDNGIAAWTGGFKVEECLDEALKKISILTNVSSSITSKDIEDVFKKTFNEISCEEIGGNLELYYVNKSKISKVLDYTIKEDPNLKRLKKEDFKKDNTSNLVKANTLIGKVILGSDLKIISDSGIVEILDNVITIKDDKGRLRTALGNYDKDKYGLLIKDKLGNKTVLDEDGMLQVWQEGNVDNANNTSPLVLNLYIPRNTLSVYNTTLSFKMLEFRAYSQATSSDGMYSDSTSTEASISDTTTSDGYARDSTENGGSDIVTSATDHSKLETTHSSTDVNQKWVETQETDGHSHSFMKTLYHEHNITIPSHNHKVNLPSHSHSFTIDDHRHSFKIPSHNHSVYIPSHSHDIQHGIFMGTKPTSVRVRINSIDRTFEIGGGNGFTTDKNNINITSYMKIGEWNQIELIPDRLGRIDASIFNQAFIGFNNM